MKTKLFLISFIFIQIYQFGFSQNPSWVTPPFFYDFSSAALQYLPVNPNPNNYNLDPFDYYDGISANHSSNGISNLDGQLNFFIIDGLIYDKDGKYLDYAWSGLFPDVTVNLDNTYSVKGNGGTETLIVPHPTNCTQYYLFGAVVEEGSHLNSYPVYALYDDCSKQIIKRGPWYSNHDNDWGTNNVDEIFHSLNTEINGDLPFIGMLWGEEVNGRGLLSLAA